MRNTSLILTISQLSRALLVAVSMAMLAACASGQQAETPLPTVTRELPAAPDKLTKMPAVPAIDSQCRFPWYGVPGCKGKDTRAMLRLTVSDDVNVRNQLGATAGWYEDVRKNYGKR